MDSTTPLSALYFQADSNPDGVALISGRTIWSFRRLAIAVEQAAQGMHARGVRKGDRVALHMFNVAELVVAFFACFRIGAIAAPINTRYKTPELRSVLKRLQPALYIGQASLFPLVDGIEPEILRSDARYVVGNVPAPWRSRSWTNLLETREENVVLDPPGANEPAVLLCTSGTTGEPKFVTHTAATLVSALRACAALGLDRAQIAINMVPPAHATGFFVLLGCLRYAAIQILVERFEPDSVLDCIERYYGTWLVGLPHMFAELLRRQRARPRKVDSLEFCVSVGDVCSHRVQEEFPEVFGIHLRSVWAATEVVGSLIHGLKAGPVSRLAPGAQVRLVDESGEQVPRGAVGEMVIRGPNVTVGYWQGPGHIQPATVDGWYRSGDLARQGEQDDLWFVARKRDVIIRGGSNIVPFEVERVLLEHPAVTDAAIVGVPDEELGQRVAAFVRLAGSNGKYVLGDILASARAQLADYKVPEWLHSVREIPRNALGKIDRKSLLSMFSDGTTQVLRRTAVLAAAALMFGSHVTPSRAEEPSTTIHVQYGDLNLSTPDGVKTLRRRIRWAAEMACGRDGGLQDIATHERYLTCVSTASDKALEKVQMALAQVQYVVK
jgi:long-chain acyl-CoA synthetase